MQTREETMTASCMKMVSNSSSLKAPSHCNTGPISNSGITFMASMAYNEGESYENRGVKKNGRQNLEDRDKSGEGQRKEGVHGKKGWKKGS